MADHTRISVQDVARCFEGLEDSRSEINQRHPLVSVIVIALMAVLAGVGGPTAIGAWANDKRDFLLALLPLSNGIPPKDVYRRVLSALKPGGIRRRRQGMGVRKRARTFKCRLRRACRVVVCGKA